MPGTSFVIAGRDALAGGQARSVYLDIAAYVHAQDKLGTPFTQSVQTFYALQAALQELADNGGVAARREIYAQRQRLIRAHLSELGVKPLLAAKDTSCVLHAYEMPPGKTYTQFHDHLKDAGFIIYAGQGKFADRVFRISMMGEISVDDLSRLGAALSAYFAG